jgi:hypothetical protein
MADEKKLEQERQKRLARAEAAKKQKVSPEIQKLRKEADFQYRLHLKAQREGDANKAEKLLASAINKYKALTQKVTGPIKGVLVHDLTRLQNKYKTYTEKTGREAAIAALGGERKFEVEPGTGAPRPKAPRVEGLSDEEAIRISGQLKLGNYQDPAEAKNALKRFFQKEQATESERKLNEEGRKLIIEALTTEAPLAPPQAPIVRG